MAINKEQFIEDIKNMTVLELAELVKAVEEEFGVSAAATAVAVAAPAAGGAAEAARRRPSSTSSSRTSVPRRSRSSRPSASSPAWASRRPRSWWTTPPSPSRKASPRKKPTRSLPRSRKSAPRWKSNNFPFYRLSFGPAYAGLFRFPAGGGEFNPILKIISIVVARLCPLGLYYP